MAICNLTGKILKVSSLVLLVAGSTLAHAGSTIKISNTSKHPWTLRISEDAAVPMVATGSRDQNPVELSAQNNRLIFSIQPGETCVLQFKETKALPLKQDVGLVDKTGTELGQLRLESKDASLVQRAETLLSQDPQDRIRTTLVPTNKAKEVLRLDAEDAATIVADSWS